VARWSALTSSANNPTRRVRVKRACCTSIEHAKVIACRTSSRFAGTCCSPTASHWHPRSPIPSWATLLVAATHSVSASLDLGRSALAVWLRQAFLRTVRGRGSQNFEGSLCVALTAVSRLRLRPCRLRPPMSRAADGCPAAVRCLSHRDRKSPQRSRCGRSALPSSRAFAQPLADTYRVIEQPSCPVFRYLIPIGVRCRFVLALRGII